MSAAMDIVDRLEFDAVRCELEFSKGVAGNIREASDEIERLRTCVADLDGHLKIALRQWKLYSEMAEANDGFDLAKDKSREGDLYRAAYSCAHEQSGKENAEGA